MLGKQIRECVRVWGVLLQAGLRLRHEQPEYRWYMLQRQRTAYRQWHEWQKYNRW